MLYKAKAAERSTNFNVGFVWSPQRGLSAGVDYFRIAQNNIISPDNAQFIINNEASFPNRVQRDEAGRLQIVTNQYANQGTRDTAGIDADVSYRFAWLNGQVQLASQWSRLLEYKQALVSGQAAINGAGNNQFDPASGAYFYDITQYNARGRVINLAVRYEF